MKKEAKEKTLNLFDFNKEEHNAKKTNKNSKIPTNKKKSTTKNTTRSNKNKEEKTKDEKFNFNEEIVIGLKKIENVNSNKKQKESKKQNLNKDKNNKKQKKDNSKAKGNKSNQVSKSIKKEKRLTPKEQLAKKKRQAVFKIVKWIMLIGIVVAGVIYTILSPIFNISTITVIGNSKVPTDEVISLSKIELGQNMFKYRKQTIIEQIKENAYIDTVEIHRRYPDAIEVVVSERKASFMIKFANAYAFINNQGYILEISNKKEKLPIIVGTQTLQEDIQIGNRLWKEDLEKLGDVLKIMKASESNNISELITEIDISKKDNYILILKKNKKTVYLGDTSNLSTKMSWILKFNELEKDTQGEIILNMNLNEDNNKPYFREKI